MSSCCRTCDHRQQTISTSRPPLEVCMITLSFNSSINPSNTATYTALNTLLNNIADSAESTSHPSTFTAWSPCLSDSKVVVIFTTASETCRNTTSAVFETVLSYLLSPPTVQHVYLDYSVTSLAASSSEARVACDLIVLQAPGPGVASAIGKRFGWDPSHSALSAHSGIGGQAAFSRPGDLIRDYWAWAELQPGAPISPSSSIGTGYESFDSRPTALVSTNSDEKNMSLFFAEDEERQDTEDETLVMIFQWSSRTDADRFKHPLQKSYGQNGQELSNDMWDRHVAHPVRQLQGIGAKTEMFKLELRGVEPRIDIGKAAARNRSGSRKFSTMALGLGEKVSGLWGR